MAIIDDVARNLGKDVGSVGMLDLMNAGLSGVDAMRAVSEAAMRAPTPARPPGFKPPVLTPTPAAVQLGNATLGQALMDLITKKPPPSTVVSTPEKDWPKQVATQKPPVYSNQPATPPIGQVVTPPVAAPALGTGALVAGGIGLLLLLLFTGRR